MLYLLGSNYGKILVRDLDFYFFNLTLFFSQLSYDPMAVLTKIQPPRCGCKRNLPQIMNQNLMQVLCGVTGSDMAVKFYRYYYLTEGSLCQSRKMSFLLNCCYQPSFLSCASLGRSRQICTCEDSSGDNLLKDQQATPVEHQTLTFSIYLCV